MTQVTRISLKGLLGATVAPFLKERGFRPKHLFFIPEVAECWQVVEFQNRKFNTATEVELTVKLGIASKRLFEFFGISQEATTIDERHWYERLGFSTPARRDIWWTVTPTSSGAIAEMLGLIADLALPELERLSHDAALRDLWLSGRSPGLGG